MVLQRIFVFWVRSSVIEDLKVAYADFGYMNEYIEYLLDGFTTVDASILFCDVILLLSVNGTQILNGVTCPKNIWSKYWLPRKLQMASFLV